MEISYLGNEDGVMDKHDKRGRRYSAEEKAAAVRMVRTLRVELGPNQGTVQRVATQLGYGPESVRAWATQADIDEGKREGVPSDSAAEIRRLEQELREVKRANEILKRAASFFQAELDRQHKR
jgi:transposase-like protein